MTGPPGPFPRVPCGERAGGTARRGGRTSRRRGVGTSRVGGEIGLRVAGHVLVRRIALPHSAAGGRSPDGRRGRRGRARSRPRVRHTRDLRPHRSCATSASRRTSCTRRSRPRSPNGSPRATSRNETISRRGGPPRVTTGRIPEGDRTRARSAQEVGTRCRRSLVWPGVPRGPTRREAAGSAFDRGLPISPSRWDTKTRKSRRRLALPQRCVDVLRRHRQRLPRPHCSVRPWR